MSLNVNKWKDYLLKSGLPLEFEVKKFLDKKGCISNLERTYFRNNEAEIPTEFSYDIDSSYIKGNHFLDLMIECKYRHESTKWVFLPEQYGSIDDINKADFMHPFDHFNEQKIPQINFPIQFAPLCSKGIELTNEGANPKSITQAVAQLSYAMADKLINAMDHQTDEVLSQHFNGTIFYNVPIIITTAHLFRLREDVDIAKIKDSENVEDVATKEPYLVIKGKPGIHLKMYNENRFQTFINDNEFNRLQGKLNSFNKDLMFVLSKIAEHDCPNSIVVIHHSKENSGLNDLFTFIDRVFEPDNEVMDLLKKKAEENISFFKKFEGNHYLNE